MKEQGFYFRPTYRKAAAALEAKDRLAFYDAIMDYWFFGNTKGPLPPAVMAAVTLAAEMIAEDAEEDA